ncbi:MAG TPA: ABC transporter permease [Spirochaetia bacterium]|nr:ABC transporter permease [Spirochaetia bacterium]
MSDATTFEEHQEVADRPPKKNMHPRLRELLFGLRRFVSNPLSVVGLVIIFFFAVVAIFAPLIAPPKNPANPYMMPHTGWETTPSPPSAAHPLGTLQQQYDILYGIVWGTRSAFAIGVAVVLANLIVGIILGVLAGYFGGAFDEIIMRITDVFFAIPFLIMAMALVVVIGRGLKAVVLVLIILNWPQYTRIIRSEILVIRDREFVQAARASGASHLRIMFQHIIPNSIYSVLILASLSVGVTVLNAAALSFLGLGSDTGYSDWGQMVSTARNWIVGPAGARLAYWYVVFIPGFAIALFVLGWNLLGDAARDVFDPKQRRK